eukprot:CAMPEP_0180146384 /NCGR_PEP_ID=MMETSP0986-20121125/18446_1 /TAXON_ID=697907 /ORGANISM="non described non described, Strain CCMP2293" /LENGTH=124 /DNA_ID=CAMNT_0022091367 /DNA_START=47 /DNA_END=422 /DNA_ORIENTATION=-
MEFVVVSNVLVLGGTGTVGYQVAKDAPGFQDLINFVVSSPANPAILFDSEPTTGSDPARPRQEWRVRQAKRGAQGRPSSQPGGSRPSEGAQLEACSAVVLRGSAGSRIRDTPVQGLLASKDTLL